MLNALTSLNAGSGIDVKALTEELLAAEREPRQKQIDSRLERVEAQISTVGHFRSVLNAMVHAVDQRIASGELSGQPQVSDPSVLGLSVTPGMTVERQSIEVQQLARGQAVASTVFSDVDAAIGEGSITIRFGQVGGTTDALDFDPSGVADLQIAIGSDQNSLAGIRDAINQAAGAAGINLQAQLVNDAGGARLMLRGGTGETSGFVVETAGDPALEAFRFGVGETGLQRTQTATDAIIALDGLAVRRSSNTITDLVPGASISLTKAAPGQPVLIAAERNVSNLAQTVEDVAGALNELRSLGAELTKSTPGSAGALSADITAQHAMRNLVGITSVQLLDPSGNGPTRLADIGISIDRTGKFNVDQARLGKAVADHPAAVEALITALSRKAGPDTPAGPLRAIAASFDAVAVAAPGKPNALQSVKTALQREQQRLDESMDRKRQAYTRQFANLDRAVNQSKALQSYLQQQIDLWTKPRN